MRKFYFNKEDSADITPTTLRQERRHTVAAKIDKIEGENTPASSRVPNASSVDRFKNEPVIPRVKTRAVAKSLSEDVLNEDHPNSAMVIKEDELASSRLYKILKDSTNHNDSPKQRSEKTGFSPVELKDPKLKPIPVKRRSSSCLCYFIIMMAICVCTVGLLATITGLLYKEIFYGKNFTLHHESDTLDDVSSFASEFRQDDDSSTNRAFHEASNELVQKSSDKVDILSENSSYKDQSEENQHGDFRKLNVSNLSQYLDRRKAEIKFQDGDTIIYEMNSSSSLEYEKNPDIRKDMVSKGHDNSGNKLKNSSKNIGRWADKRIKEKIEELENFDTFMKSHSGMSKELLDGGSKQDLQTSDTFNNEMVDSVNSRSLSGTKSEDLNPTSTKKEMETLRFQSSVPNSEIKSALLIEEKTSSVYPEQKIGNEEKLKSKDLNLSINEKSLTEPKELEFKGKPTLKKINETTAEIDVISSQTVDINFQLNKAKPDSRSTSSSVIINGVKDSIADVTTKPQLLPFDNAEEKNHSLIERKKFFFPVSENESQKNQQNRNDYVESMLEVINESEKLKDTISKRDGDIISLTEFSSTTLQPVQSSIIVKNPVARVTTELQNFQDQRKSSSKEQAMRIKPLDLRVSLAEAMKHLQVLDVNNKLLTSRTKPNGRKPQNTKQAINKKKPLNTKQSSNEDISREKMQYLQNLRLMLQENMQRA